MNLQEEEIRQRLQIPSNCQYVLIIDQAAHIDWDWNNTFLGYFNDTKAGNSGGAYAGVNVLLTAAMNVLQSWVNMDGPSYYYSICEMGYFRQFVESNPGMASAVKSALQNQFLRIVGGGITSPDCLLSAGEAFIRNYLLGKLWLAATFGSDLAQLRHCWIPDDFGQDPELPVVIKALGMESVAFSRLPGYAPGVTFKPDLVSQLLQSGGTGVDFQWMASDQASSVFTHWMPGGIPGYFWGGDLFQVQSLPSDDQPAAIVAAIQKFLVWYNVASYPNHPVSYNVLFPGAPTPYLYMPLDEDFMNPIPTDRDSGRPLLLNYMDTWNNSPLNSQNQVWAVEASYDDFVALVLAWQTTNKLKTLNYNGTPYWSGYYASRPQIKALHYGATRMLLAAEVIGLLASGELVTPKTPPQLEASYWSNVAAAWDTLVPSTHHDYITGTSTDGTPKNSPPDPPPPDVVDIEQIPRLNAAWSQAQILVADQSLNTLAGSVQTPSVQSALIVNRLGQPFTGIVELPSPVPPGINSIVIGSQGASPVQPTAEGGLVFCASLDSLSYTVGGLSSVAVPTSSQLTISPTTSGEESYTLQNGKVQIIVSASANWGISAIQDNSLLQKGGFANDLVVYQDAGNIYQFGNELTYPFQVAQFKTTTVGSGLGATVLEAGPVRVRLQTVVSINGINYTREYSLGVGDPFVRMTTTGSAPSRYSVMVQFPFAPPVATINHGTACHWTSQQPLSTWAPPIFRPTHNFVLPYAADKSLLHAIYHSDVPAWGFDASGVLLGCLFRNTPGSDRGAIASDPSTSTLNYALRPIDGPLDPTTGQPLAEAMSFNAPPMACMVPSHPTGALPSNAFLAEVSVVNSPDSTAFILAAKPSDVTPGTLILRLYQPTNSPHTLLQVKLGRGKPASVVAVTALEDPIPASEAPAIAITADGFTIDTVTALNTVQISF